MEKNRTALVEEIEAAAKKFSALGVKEKDPGKNVQFKRYSPRPGHPDWDEISRRADELVTEALKVIETDTSSPREKLAETRRVADALTTSGKSILTSRRRLKEGSHTLLPAFFIWTMHNTCNFRCSYCDNHGGKKYFDLPNEGTLDTENGKRLLEIVRKNTTGIYFCGGEPTLRRDLPELTRYAHDLNYFPLMINTNGSRIHKMLVDPRYSRWLKDMDIIIVSLDALDTARLRSVWGVDEDLCKQVVANILALRRLQSKVRFKLIVNTVITPDTISEADAILDWADDLGIWYSPVPMNCGPMASGDLMSNPEYVKLRDKIIARKKAGAKILGSRKLVSDLLYGAKIDCKPSLKPHVDIDGSLIWPCKTASKINPVKVNVLEYKSLDAAYRAAAKLISPDNIHGHGAGQCGADCNWMQNYVSDVYARGLANPLSSGLFGEIAEFVGIV